MDESTRLEGGRLGDISQRLEDVAWETALSQNELTARFNSTPTLLAARVASNIQRRSLPKKIRTST
jgi:hypothetical protein